MAERSFDPCVTTKQQCFTVNNTLVRLGNITFEESEVEINNVDDTQITLGDYEITDNIADYSILNKNPEIIHMLDDWLDHFHIEKISN